jgi:catalase
MERDFLQQELRERLGRAPSRPVKFLLELQLASVEDLEAGRVSDPTAVWPGEREKIVTAGAGDRRNRYVTAGVLELKGLWEGPPRGRGLTAFNPLPDVDGIEPSDDSLLRFRRSVYELSYDVRTGRAKLGGT